MSNEQQHIPPEGSPDDEFFQAALISQRNSPEAAEPDDVDQSDTSAKPATSNQGKILGLPTPLFFIVVGFITIGLVILIVAIASAPSKNNQQAQAPSNNRQQEVQLSAEISALQSKVSASLSVAESAGQEVAKLRSDMDKRFATSDTSSLDNRILEVEKSIHEIKSSMNAMRRMIANNRPLSDNMAINPSATIISIGSGVARVRDEYGEEFSLQKGDKWDGTIVMSIRADLRRVILSNGTILQ